MGVIHPGSVLVGVEFFTKFWFQVC